MSNELNKTVKNVTDAVKEGIHRGEADSERDMRAEYGDVMTPGEKGASVAREISSNVKAAGDHVKRDVRNKT